jgi:hypothetical protein
MQGRLIALLAIAAVCLTACVVRARQLEVADVLPPNYDEQVIPETFMKGLGDVAYAPGVWTRCFDCDLDWQGLKDHLRLNPKMIGYRDTTEDWLKVWAKRDIPADVMREFTKVYSSPNGSYHVFLFNLKAIRDKGIIVGSGGDFLILCGPDRIEAYS